MSVKLTLKSNTKSKTKMSMVLNTCQHTHVNLGNAGSNKADDSYSDEHKKIGALPTMYISTILKINLLKESIIKHGDFDNR